MDLNAAVKLGLQVGLQDIAADEFYAMLVIQEEMDKFEDEKARKG